jgi:hypothetical protein
VSSLSPKGESNDSHVNPKQSAGLSPRGQARTHS